MTHIAEMFTCRYFALSGEAPMDFCFMKKNKIFITTLSLFLFTARAESSTSLMAAGHGGVIGQYSSNTPPLDSTYFAFRVPVGLTLQASPSDNLNIYLGLDYAYNNYPESAVLMGQTNATTSKNSNGQATPMPFANTVSAGNGSSSGTPYSQKVDFPTLTTAYFTYQTPIGLFKAGRMPRNWGLGVWYSDEWTPIGGTISTSDAVAFTTDLNLFDISFYYERYGEAIGGNSTNSSAVAYSAEVRLKTNPADAPSTGVSREIGIAFSKFDHGQSETSLNILDMYGKFYLSRFFISGEFLYPSGKTKNANYQTLGGAPECSVSRGITTDPAISTFQSCQSQQVSALAALLKLKVQLGGMENSSLAATDASQKLLGTAERQETNVMGLWGGYASGGTNQFYSATDQNLANGGGNTIRAITMNPNIQPSFLMFNNTTPPVNGMPTGAITNTTFLRLDYTYENPIFGAIGPALIWAQLNRTNKNYGDNTYATCTKATTDAASVSSSTPINRMCVGGSNNLGVEVDVSYRYTTMDRVQVGLDLGYWFIGNAWQISGRGTPSSTYGFRIYTGTEF